MVCHSKITDKNAKNTDRCCLRLASLPLSTKLLLFGDENSFVKFIGKYTSTVNVSMYKDPLSLLNRLSLRRYDISYFSGQWSIVQRAAPNIHFS